MTFKILFVGYDKADLPQANPNLDIELLTRKFQNLSSPPALFDYHVLVLDISMINAEFDKRREPVKDKEVKIDEAPSDEALNFDDYISSADLLFRQQVETGGLVICFADAETRSWGGTYYVRAAGGYMAYKHESKSCYSWSPIQFKVVNRSGPHVYPRPETGEFKVLTDSFREEDRSWSCYFTEYPNGSKVLFTNRADYAVGLEVPLGKGRLVFLPRFSNMKYATKLLIEKVVAPRLGIEATKEPTSIRQPWVAKFEFSSKRKAVEELERARSKIAEYSKLEPLLDASGEELRQAVKLAFEKIGFQVVQPPEGQPVQDLDLALDGWKAIVEVKGKEGDANLDDLRQLLQYLVGLRDIEGKPDMNAIFVVNHFCKTDCEKRNAPFTQSAIDLANKHKIVLLTSSKIYFAIGKVLEGKDTFDALRTRITQGKPLN